MLFIKSIYDSIFQELAIHQDHSIQELHKAIYKKEKISLPNFYKIIDGLLSNQMVTKENGKIKLHTAWILSLFDLSEKVKEHYINQNNLSIDLQEGQQKIFHASNLVDLDNIWSELLNMIAIKEGKDTSLYMYNSHVYHILGLPETETANFRNMHQRTKSVFLLVGNESIMDVYASNLIRLQGINILCKNSTKFLKDGYFINTIGDYILECLFPDIINQYFKLFFDNIQDIKDFNPQGFENIFKMKTNCKITLRHSKNQAKSFQKEIMKYF